MIRIGFDPVLEAQQRQQEIIREVQQYRLADEISNGTQPKTRSGFKFVALIGRQLEIIGASLSERYGDKPVTGSSLDQSISIDGCR
jgi:hypothetical protein